MKRSEGIQRISMRTFGCAKPAPASTRAKVEYIHHIVAPSGASMPGPAPSKWRALFDECQTRAAQLNAERRRRSSRLTTAVDVATHSPAQLPPGSGEPLTIAFRSTRRCRAPDRSTRLSTALFHSIFNAARHGSCIRRRGSCAARGVQNPCRSWSAAVKYAHR